MGASRTTRRSKRETAEEAWRLLSEFSRKQFQEKAGAVRGLGLTPGHMRALLALEPENPRPIGVCANEIGCDASTATWLIDRLEEKGLAERRPSPGDRRVKAVALTPLGEETKAELRARWDEPPPKLLDLDPDALESLVTIFRELSQHAQSGERVRNRQSSAEPARAQGIS